MMEIGDCGIKEIQDIADTVHNFTKTWEEASEILQDMCRAHGDRFFGMLCELAAKYMYGVPLDPLMSEDDAYDIFGRELLIKMVREHERLKEEVEEQRKRIIGDLKVIQHYRSLEDEYMAKIDKLEKALKEQD